MGAHCGLGAGHSLGEGMYRLLLWEMQWLCRDRDGNSVVGLTGALRLALPLHPSWLSGDVTDLCLSLALCVSLCFGKPKYAGVQMAMSKVHRAQTFLGAVSRGAAPLIQIVLIDDRAGAQAGTAAEQLAADIMQDIAQHGNPLSSSAFPLQGHPDPLLARALYSLPAAHMARGV